MKESDLQNIARIGKEVYIHGIYNIHLKKMDDVIKLIPIGDIHRDNELCDTKRWGGILKKCKENDDRYTHYIGTGDYSEFAATSDQFKLKSSKLHDSTLSALDERALNIEDTLVKELSFMGKRIIGLGSGNHEWEYTSGKDRKGLLVTECMCSRLGCMFLGDLCYIIVNVWYRGEKMCHFDIVMAHGRKGGGKLLGTHINHVVDLREIFANADIYIMAHDHRRFAVPDSTLYVIENEHGEAEEHQKRQVFIRSGSLLRALVHQKRSYVVGMLTKPNELGTVRAEISLKKSGSLWIPDIHTWS